MLRALALSTLALLVACGDTAPEPATKAPAAPAAAPAASSTPAAGKTEAVAKAPDGEAIYNQYCVACHGADGKGNNGLGGSYAEVLPGKTDAELIKSIKEGKTSPTGAAMPPWGGTLKDEQIKAVLAYVKDKYGPKSE